MKFRALFLIAALASLFLLSSGVATYAIQAERTVILNLHGTEYRFSIISYDFEDSTTVTADEELLREISSVFGGTAFTFYNSVPRYEVGDSFIELDPKVSVGDELTVRFIEGEMPVSPEPEVQITNVMTEPAVVNVGNEFRIAATVVNLSDETVFYSGICESPLSAEFSSNVMVESRAICLAFEEAPLSPGQSVTVGGDNSEQWIASSVGMTDATVIFTYWTDLNRGRFQERQMFSFEINPMQTPELQRVSVSHEGGRADIMASLSNGRIDGARADVDFTSLIITTDASANSPGQLTVVLPRQIIDSKMGGTDQEFIVLANGEEAEYEETRTTQRERELMISVPAGTDEVEIIGTSVIPEFPLGIMAVTGIALTAVFLGLRLNRGLSVRAI